MSTMAKDGRQTALIAAAFVVGVLGVAAAFLKMLGGFDGTMEIARKIFHLIF
jgi:hypothetical protein